MQLAVKLLLFALVGIALFAAATAFFARRHEARANASFPPHGQLIEVDGVEVHAVVSGQGPDVVLIHGSSGNARDMTFRLAPLLAEKYRVIAFDRPGLGFTERVNDSGATITQQAELLSRAAVLLGAERPVVVGHSYGGAVALAWAVNQPDRVSALVPLAAASNPWTTPLDTLYQVTSHPVGSTLVVPMLTAFVPDGYVETAVARAFDPQSVPEGYSGHFGPALTLRRVSLRANAMQRANLLDEIEALHTRYGEIAVPTEIVHGDADDTVALSLHSANLANQIPGANLTVLPGIGHMLHHAVPEEIVQAVDRAAARAGLR
ncbi:alpha/beta fold hydrolase [Lutimaribacter marinistellae]|uniref:Alpha/beta fold hydrolase n=1 Tax=Lutimaribacter marinistellae TaxID=1820329 RepID=A0ABV7TMG9_9RHOB